jgi:inner membrane transporter RhtA
MLLGSIASVQIGAGIAVKLFDRIGPGGAVMLRLVLSAVVLGAIARPRLAGRTRRQIAAAVVFGLILGVMNWTFYEALDRIPLGVAVTIEFLGPLAVALAGSRRLLDLVWVVLAGGGVALLTLPGDTEGITGVGVLLSAIAAVLWGSYIIASQRVGAAFPALQGLAVSLAVGSVIVLPVGIAQGGTELVHPAILAAGFGVAMLSSLVPYSLELVALRRLRTSTFGLLMSLEPAVGALAGVLILGQRMTGLMSVAVLMVVAASVGCTIGERRRKPELAQGPQEPSHRCAARR